jgi:hypothetical protein
VKSLYWSGFSGSKVLEVIKKDGGDRANPLQLISFTGCRLIEVIKKDGNPADNGDVGFGTRSADLTKNT